MQKKSSIKCWEAALLLALCASLCWGEYTLARQSRLTAGIIRLHVIAHSDDADEQAVKLRVRDEVSRVVLPLTERCQSPAEARAAIEAALPEIEEAARSAGGGRAVSVSFGRQRYGTRQGDGYTLPAGIYDSLRVTLGDGAGHNWWGVIFPQLTPQGVTDYASAAKVLGEDNVRLITSDGEGYVIRFQLLEWMEALKSRFSEDGTMP